MFVRTCSSCHVSMKISNFAKKKIKDLTFCRYHLLPFCVVVPLFPVRISVVRILTLVSQHFLPLNDFIISRIHHTRKLKKNCTVQEMCTVKKQTSTKYKNIPAPWKIYVSQSLTNLTFNYWFGWSIHHICSQYLENTAYAEKICK